MQCVRVFFVDEDLHLRRQFLSRMALEHPPGVLNHLPLELWIFPALLNQRRFQIAPRRCRCFHHSSPPFSSVQFFGCPVRVSAASFLRQAAYCEISGWRIRKGWDAAVCRPRLRYSVQTMTCVGAATAHQPRLAVTTPLATTPALAPIADVIAKPMTTS